MTSAQVRAALADAEPEVRRRAAQKIPLLSAPESCELLLSALGDTDWRVRKEAAAIAMRVEPRTAVVFAVARALAERDNIGLRNAAVEALVLIGPDAVPGAIDALGRLDADGRKLAVEVLAGAPTLAGMKTLVRAVGDADPNVVVAIAEGLGKAHLAGEEAREFATATLTTLLPSEHTAVRVAALEALRALDAPVPWASLEPLLNEPLLRRNAIAVAGGTTAPRAFIAFATAIADANPSLSREATAALGRSIEEAWGSEDLLEVAARTLRASSAAHARLRELAKEIDDPQIRGAAILALGLVRDPDDVSLIADALADDELAERAEAALSAYGHEAVEPLLLAAPRSAAPSLRGAAISMLPVLTGASIAPAPPPSSDEIGPLTAVREALSDPSPEVVVPALKSLAIVGGAGDLALVAPHTKSSDAKVAAAAQSALLAIATRQPLAAHALVSGVDPRGDDTLAAVTVLEALARAEARFPNDIRFLSSALTHRAAAVRRGAIDALAEIGGSEAAREVTMHLADEEAVVALAAIRALGRLGRGDQLALLAASTKDPLRLATALRALRQADPERAFAAARPLLRARDPSIASAAIEVIGSIEQAGRVEALLDATEHVEQEVVKLALTEIAKLDDERALATLAGALEHEAESVRRCTAELLGHVTGPEVETLLRARLDRERVVEVRHAIMQALAARRAG